MALQIRKMAAWIVPALFITFLSKTAFPMCPAIPASNMSGSAKREISTQSWVVTKIHFELDELKPGTSVLARHLQHRSRSANHPYDDLFGTRKTNEKACHGRIKRRPYLRRQTALGRKRFRFQNAGTPKSGDAKISPVFVGYGRIPGLRKNSEILRTIIA